jgi:hypothetical protein
VFVVSDGTGETATEVVRAAMAQFQSPWRLRTFAETRSASQAQRVVALAAESGALLVFTLVDKELAAVLREAAAEHGVPAVDVLGPVIARVGEHLRAEPRGEPGLLHGFSDDYFKRVEAVEFAVRHDDGANLHTLFQADLVLIGVSRTSKTPLAMYLAHRGYKTGNVPLVPGMDPQPELLDLDPRKVFGLVVAPDTLVEVRRSRMRALQAPPWMNYADPEPVQAELQRARRVFRERGWRVVDITNRAVEENAARIIELYEGWRATPQDPGDPA